MLLRKYELSSPRQNHKGSKCGFGAIWQGSKSHSTGTRVCVSTRSMNNLNGRKFPVPSNCRGFSSRACCCGLVLRPDIMAGSMWWLTETERRVQGLTVSRICLPWPPFLPIGYTSYRCTTGEQTNFEQSKWPLRHFRSKPYMVKNHN